MKIIVLDYRNGTVEIVPMTKTAQCQHNMGEFNAEAYLSERGFPTSDCNWMVCDQEEVPVYWYNEVIPVAAL